MVYLRSSVVMCAQVAKAFNVISELTQTELDLAVGFPDTASSTKCIIVFQLPWILQCRGW